MRQLTVRGILCNIFICVVLAVLLVGCQNKEPSEGEDVETASVPSVTAQTDTVDGKGTGTGTTAVESVSETTVPERDNPYEIDENGAFIYAPPHGVSDEELIAAAQIMYERACEVEWAYEVGCPYELDYSSTAENEFGWQYYEIKDSRIHNLKDVMTDYCETFMPSRKNQLSELYMEERGKVYALSGARGKNQYFLDATVKSVASDASGLTFAVEVRYDGDDFTSDIIVKHQRFGVYISASGRWRVTEFELPY